MVKSRAVVSATVRGAHQALIRGGLSKEKLS
jgi:hypothetical protein